MIFSKSLCQTRGIFRMGISRGCAWMSTRAVAATPSGPSFRDTIMPGNEIEHLLENENEYGIAKPLHMDRFQKENYHNKLQEDEQEVVNMAQPSSSRLVAASTLIMETQSDTVKDKKKGFHMHGKTEEPKKMTIKVDPTKIHEYKHNYDEAEF